MIGVDAAQVILAWGFDSVVVLTPLIAAVWALDRFALRRVDPRLAHGVWLIVLVRLLVPPALLPWPAIVAPIDVPAGAWFALAPEAPALPPVTLLITIWAAGSLIVAASWLLRARRASHRLSLEGGEAPAMWRTRLSRIIDEARLARRPWVLVDSLAVAPYVTGLLRPRLVLPVGAEGWPPTALEHAVRHELAHLRRRDLWAEAAWMAACAIYWFHPLVHVARRRAYDAREMCCDAEVASLVGPGYRDSLLRMAARLVNGSVTAPPQHGWHPIVWRLQALEQQPARRSWRARLTGAASLVLVALLCLSSHIRLSAAPEPAVDLAGLVDPATRLEMGRGSLHVRYALLPYLRAQEPTR